MFDKPRLAMLLWKSFLEFHKGIMEYLFNYSKHCVKIDVLHYSMFWFKTLPLFLFYLI